MGLSQSVGSHVCVWVRVYNFPWFNKGYMRSINSINREGRRRLAFKVRVLMVVPVSVAVKLALNDRG